MYANTNYFNVFVDINWHYQFTLNMAVRVVTKS